MEAVPDKGHHSAAQTDVHDRQAHSVCDLLAQTDLRAQEEKRDQDQNEQSGIDIGHTVADIRVRTDKEPADKVEYVILHGEFLRESRAGRGRFLKSKVGRYRKERRESAGKQRVNSKTPYGGPEILQVHPLRDGDIQDRCIEHQEQTYEVSGIEIRDQADCKGDAVQKRLLVAEHLDKSENDQRKEHDRIMPHDVPEIRDRPAAECVEAGEGCQEQILSSLVEFF